MAHLGVSVGSDPKDCSRCPAILPFQFSPPCRSYERAIMCHKPHNFMITLMGCCPTVLLAISTNIFLSRNQSDMKRILYVGTLSYGGTCLQRLTSFKELGHEMDSIDTTFPKVSKNIYLALRILWRWGFILICRELTSKSLAQVKHNIFDLVWIDKGLTISAKTLLSMKKIQPSCLLVSYHPDDVMNPRIQSRKYISHFTLL